MWQRFLFYGFKGRTTVKQLFSNFLTGRPLGVRGCSGLLNPTIFWSIIYSDGSRAGMNRKRFTFFDFKLNFVQILVSTIESLVYFSSINTIHSTLCHSIFYLSFTPHLHLLHAIQNHTIIWGFVSKIINQINQSSLFELFICLPLHT